MRNMFVNGKRRRWMFASLGLAAVIAVVAVVGFTLVGGRPAHASGIGDGGFCPQQWDGTPSCQFKGFVAEAGNYTIDTTTCASGVYTSVWVDVAQNVTHALPGAVSATDYASVSVTKYDTCSYNYTQVYGYTTTPNLVVMGQTEGATLHATIPTTINWTSQPGPTYTVNATWKGVGDVATLTTTRDYRNGNIITHYRQTGNDRTALANATVSDGVVSYTISGMGEIGYAKVGALSIFHV